MRAILSAYRSSPRFSARPRGQEGVSSAAASSGQRESRACTTIMSHFVDCGAWKSCHVFRLTRFHSTFYALPYCYSSLHVAQRCGNVITYKYSRGDINMDWHTCVARLIVKPPLGSPAPFLLHTVVTVSQRVCSWSASLPGRLLFPRLLRPTLPSRSLWLVGSHERRRRHVPPCLALTNRINSPCSLALRAIELLELWRVRVIHGSAFGSAAQVAQDQHDKAKGDCAHANALGPVGSVSIRVQGV